MKKSIFLFCLLFTSISYAQVVTISEEMSLRKEEAYHIVGRMKGQTLVFQDRETEFSVQAFDENLKKTWDKEILLDKRRPKVLDVVSDEKAFHVIYEYHQKSETFIKIHTYDAASNLVDSTLIKNFGSSLLAQTYEVMPSENRSKLLVYSTENNRTINALVFDIDRREVLWEKSISPDKLLLGRDETQIVLNDEGDLHVVVAKDNFKYKLEEHHYEGYYISADDTTLKTYTIDMRSHLSYDVYFEYDNINKRLQAGGLYGIKNQAWAEGAFYLSIDPDNPDAHTMAFHPFEENLVKTFLGKGAPSKNKGIDDAVVQDVLFRQDGGIISIVERKKVNERPYARSTTGYYNPAETSQLTDYYYEDLMAISIHPDGRFHWATTLQKKQFSQEGDVIFASYFPLKTSSTLRLIFNDDIKYENTVSEYVLRGSGRYDHNSVMSTDNQKIRLRFQDAIQIGTNVVLVPSEFRSRLRLVRIVFEE